MSYRNEDDAMDLLEWERSNGDAYEEPRFTCSRHPHVVVSNGTFDAPCGCCEAEMDDAAYEAEMAEQDAFVGPLPQFCPF